MLGGTLVLSAAFFWALGAVMYRVSLRTADPIGLNFVRSLPAILLLFVIALLADRLSTLAQLNPELTLYVIVASIIGWIVGDSLYFVGLKLLGVSKAVPLCYSYPLFLIPLSHLFLGGEANP